MPFFCWIIGILLYCGPSVNCAENLGKVRRWAIGLMRKVKGKQTVPVMMDRATLSPNYRTTMVEQTVKGEF